MYIEKKKKKKRILSVTFSKNSKGIKIKEAFARRLRRSYQTTSRRDDVRQVKTESVQTEGHFPQSQMLWREVN